MYVRFFFSRIGSPWPRRIAGDEVRDDMKGSSRISAPANLGAVEVKQPNGPRSDQRQVTF